MSNYVILTDSACDLKPQVLRSFDVEYINLHFRFENENEEYSNEEMEIKTFYDRMRNGEIAKTTAINPDSFYAVFEKILKEDKDILYLGFSSGLSTTFNCSRIAAEE